MKKIDTARLKKVLPALLKLIIVGTARIIVLVSDAKDIFQKGKENDEKNI